MDRANEGTCNRGIEYQPLFSQKKFHDSPARFKGFSGPIGSGKSQALCQEAIKLSYQNPGRSGLIGAPTYPMLRDATQPALFEILDRNRIPYDFNKAENVMVMKDSGSRVLFRALDEFERLRGTNLAWFGLDELTYTPEEAWLRLEGRLRDPKAKRLCGFAVWTPKGFDWVYQKFIAEPVPGYEAVVARPHENRFVLEKIPDFYERLKRSYDEQFYQQEVLGQYLNMQGGLVYSAFSRADHIVECEGEPGKTLLWAMDFNVNPMCSVVAQRQGQRIVVLDEIVMRHATTLDACVEFMRRYPSHRGGLVVYGDASGNSTHSTGGTDYEMIREFFRTCNVGRVQYKVPKKNPKVRDRITETNSALRTASSDIRLWIHGRCKELIKDFEQVAYKAGSVEIDKDRDRKRTHLSDALGYLLWQERMSPLTFGERDKSLGIL